MSVFQLLEWLPVKVAALNLPSRKKGSDVIHTTDIVVECEGSNTLLNHFDPELLDMLYREVTSADEEQQAEIEGMDRGISSKPMLRTSALRSPIPLALEFVGYTLTIDRGLGGKDSNIAVDEVTVKSIRLWPKEGGSVKISLHMQSRNVSDLQVGQLRALLKLETKLKLTAPQVKQMKIEGTPEEHFKNHLASGDPLAKDLEPAGGWPFPGGKDGAGAEKPAAAPVSAKGGKKPAADAKPPEKKLTLKERQAKAREEATAAFVATGASEATH